METAGIVAFAFGMPENIISNQRVAEIASEKARELGAPVYTQRDVSIERGIEALHTLDLGDPPPTLLFARDAIQWAIRQGYDKLWIVAAKPHLPRCVRDINYAVSESGAQIQVCVCEEIEQYPEDSWFCSDSMQPRTRSRKKWQRRERILELMPFFLYEIVAG